MPQPFIEKTVAEKLYVGLNFFDPDLPTGETISTATAAVSPSGLTLSGAVVISSNQVKQLILGGTDEKTYTITFTVTMSGGQIFTPSYTVRVI